MKSSTNLEVFRAYHVIASRTTYKTISGHYHGLLLNVYFKPLRTAHRRRFFDQPKSCLLGCFWNGSFWIQYHQYEQQSRTNPKQNEKSRKNKKIVKQEIADGLQPSAISLYFGLLMGKKEIPCHYWRNNTLSINSIYYIRFA